MKQQIHHVVAQVLAQMGMGIEAVQVEATDNPAHGDYTTNAAMVMFGNLKSHPPAGEPHGTDIHASTPHILQWKSPRELAQAIVDKIIQYRNQSNLLWLDRVEVAGPGFINFFLSEASLIRTLGKVLHEKERFGRVANDSTEGRTPSKQADPDAQKPQETVWRKATPLKNNALKELVSYASYGAKLQESKTIMVEFAHPNTHKAFHIGHLRNITTGESIVRLLEAVGKKVIRANYQGDVGMHIAKALYGLLHICHINDRTEDVKGVQESVALLSRAYAAGNKAYEDDPTAKAAIERMNKQIYQKDPEIYGLYQKTRQWSLDYFDTIYKRVGSRFDRYYFESEVYEAGRTYVLEGLKQGLFEESEGAVIFPGEKYGLHNRVFITRDGNTTYEGKDVGLARLQFDEYKPDCVIHVVGPEQAGYFQVVFEALAQLFPDTRGREYHLIYGWVKLKRGKMSSREGNVVLGEWLLDEAEKEIQTIIDQGERGSKAAGEHREDIARKAAVAAVKYAFLRVSTKQEIAFDLAESVSFDGDSGPYLQYTYARCRSVIRKAGGFSVDDLDFVDNQGAGILNPEERTVARLIIRFPEVVEDAAYNFAPNALCAYLFALAQAFNVFYAKHSILENRGLNKDQKGSRNEPRISHLEPRTSNLRLALTAATAQVLKNGLTLLGIETLEQM